MSGGDVGPLGANAVKQIHDTFDWAVKSPKGMILFVDEADAFLSRRDGDRSEAMRSAINALLYRTGDQSRDFMVVLATNRPGACPCAHALAQPAHARAALACTDITVLSATLHHDNVTLLVASAKGRPQDQSRGCVCPRV